MLVALAYHKGDQEQAARLATWIAELGPYPVHEILLLPDKLCADFTLPDMGFAKVHRQVVVGDGWQQWPMSPNKAWRTTAKHIEFTMPQPWLWIEADIVPLRAGWLDAIAAEYATCGKPFMGDLVHVENVPGFVDHCSGVAVYPARMTQHAGEALLAHEVAWDVAAAAQIVPKMHKTLLIQHGAKRFAEGKTYLDWKNPKFESIEQVRAEIRAEAVVFHANKDGSLIELLRNDKFVTAVAPLLHEVIQEQRTKWIINPAWKSAPLELDARTGAIFPRSFSERGLTCDIFIKTYPPDWSWFTYCHTSCLKFATGFRKIYVVAGAPIHDGMQLKKPVGVGTNWIETPTDIDFRMEYGLGNPNQDLYLSQQIFKLYADTLTDAEFICHIDSDTIFTRPVTPETYFTDDKINWMMTPYSMVETPWKPITEKFLGRPVEFEFMRRAPVMLPRWIYPALREFCVKKHGRTLEQYVMEQPHRAYSEYNALGAFAYYFHNDKFNWINTAEVPEKDWPILTVRQCKSWDGLTPAIVAEFDSILAQDVAEVAASSNAPTQPTVLSMPLQFAKLQNMVMAKIESCSGCAATKEQAFNFYERDDQGNFYCAEHNVRWFNPNEPKVAQLPWKDGHIDIPNRTDNWQQYIIQDESPIRQTAAGHWIISDDSHISRWVEETGRLDHDQNLLPDILPEIPVGGTVVDAGANIGSHTHAYLERVGESGKVLAIEPNEDAWDCLRRNCSRAKISRAALWDKAVKLTVVQDANAGASYVREDAQGAVQGVTLDSLLKNQRIGRVDFVKADVEGNEVRLLRGAEKTIARYRPTLFIEVNKAALKKQGSNANELLGWLESHGYSHKVVQSNRNYGDDIYDVLAKPLLPPNECLTERRFKELSMTFDTVPESKPWASSVESIEEIKRLAARLKSFATAPAYVKRIRDELTLAGVIHRAVKRRKKRRKVWKKLTG